MDANPFLGVVLHAIGGLAAASFYLPLKSVRRWAWENFWIVNGVVSWLIAPIAFASFLVPGTLGILHDAPARSIVWTIGFGALWGVGGLTFGLTMRYLGIALGYAIALGLCAACGTLIPPIFDGTLGSIIAKPSGKWLMLGVGMCLLGIAFGGWAGISKERELSVEQKRASVREFHFGKGLAIAILCGVTSAAMAFAIAAGKPIAELAVARGARPLWQTLPIYVYAMLGGFVTNAIYCGFMMLRNGTLGAFASRRPLAAVDRATATPGEHDVSHGEAEEQSLANDQDPRGRTIVRGDGTVPLLRNYLLCAAAGLTWYFQFFFYGMGTTQMGRYDFSSWTLHMASIILFSTLWGIAYKEWRGTSARTHVRIAIGLALLVGSMGVVGYSNYVAAH